MTFSGSRGQKVPVAIYRIDTNYNVKPFLHEMMNPTGLALDRAGSLYVSSRYDGTVYRVAPNGTMTSYAEGMGVATGIAFDPRAIFTSAIAAGPSSRLAATVRSLSLPCWSQVSRPIIWRSATMETSTSPARPRQASTPFTRSIRTARCRVFYRGLGRPQGLAVDIEGNLYVAASLNGRRGIVKVTPDSQGVAGGIGTQSGRTGVRSRAVPWCWPPPAACIISPGTSKAADWRRKPSS